MKPESLTDLYRGKIIQSILLKESPREADAVEILFTDGTALLIQTSEWVSEFVVAHDLLARPTT